MRFSIHQGPPADAESYKTLKWTRSESSVNGQPILKMWRGKSLKPFLFHVYRDAAAVERAIEATKADEDRRQEYKAEQKAERIKRREQTQREIQVGTILHYSWGYDQTQCEYFEVIERRGLMVVIREIASKSVPGSEQFMSDSRCPAPGEFIGEPMRKRIMDFGISMDHGTARPVHPWEKNYCSWYA